MAAIGPIRQLGYVTQDVEAAAMHWINKGIAGPFFLMKGAVFGEWTSEGKTASATLDIAFGQSGDVMIELITPRDGALDLYRSELLKTRICNPHHLGYLGRVDKRDSQPHRVVIQGCFLRSSHGPRGFVGC